VIIEDSLYKPKASTGPLSHLLAKNISAIELNGIEGGKARLGPVLQLPNGAQLDVCGEGFNEKTVKIRLNGKYYFVFRSDLGMN
jgi:hypothetical protein